MTRRASFLTASLFGALAAAYLANSARVAAAGPFPTPEQFAGFRIGTDNKLVRWNRIVDYMKLAAAGSDRVRLRELGKTSGGNPLVVVEISAPETLKNLGRYHELERQLYFQDGALKASDRDEVFRQGKVVVLVTCSIHANEIGATQMSLELVHHLATDHSSRTKKILDNVILLLVPSLNPDGQILITDWFNRNLGTAYDGSPMPYLYHPYAGHDNNRDMYMFTQKESQYMADLAWHDWFPAVWLDEHQMGPDGPRIFVMPAAGPISANVHPLIARWNAMLGQSQAAALEAAGKDGVIYNSAYTNFGEGAMAWAGWWHNQIGLLTEVASVNIAAPILQQRASSPLTKAGTPANQSGVGWLPPPTAVTPRRDYPRPWLGGAWTLRDIVDYELIATEGLLDAAADHRETILREIYEVNRQTIEGKPGDPTAIALPLDRQHDAREVAHLVDRLQVGGVDVYRADTPFEADGRHYAPGTFVIPMTQVFSRYAKDLLEKQTYPQPRPGEGGRNPPYDVTAWSLGMLLGVDVDFISTPLPASLKLVRNKGLPISPGGIEGTGNVFAFGYTGPDSAIAINRLLARGAVVTFDRPSHLSVRNIDRDGMERLAKDLGLSVTASDEGSGPAGRVGALESRGVMTLRPARVALYSPWTGRDHDEGWTRWVLEQYEFNVTMVHNADIRAGALRKKFDALILADQNPREILDGFTGPTIRPEYRGGIGDEGVNNLARFVADGGTLVTLGLASDLAIDHLPLPVRDEKRWYGRDEHFAPGTIVHIDVDSSNPIGYGMAAETYGFYDDGPFFAIRNRSPLPEATIVARYPKSNVLASGRLEGEDLMADRAAVVSIDMNPGHVILFGLRPQHRAQTHATFPMLFNALYLAAARQ